MQISATEFKSKCLGLLDYVDETGDVLEITKHGKPVAKLVSVREEPPWLQLRGAGKFVGDPLAPVVDESDLQVLK